LEKYSIYFKKFKIACAILGATILIFVILISKIVPQIQNIVRVQGETRTQTGILTDNERRLADLQASVNRREESSFYGLKVFYKPIESGLDAETVLSDEFGEILTLIRNNQIKTRSIKYDYDLADDSFIKNSGDKFTSCKLALEMVANYSNFENFLRDLYKHEHFLNISQIEIVPYQKDKKILLVNAQISIYAQKEYNDRMQTAEKPKAPISPAPGQGMPSPDITQSAPANTAKKNVNETNINPLPADGLAVPMVN